MWALEHGLDTITWTYDPLIRRNAYFNIAKLGAVPVSYHVDFYGEMTDAVNVGQGSDRLSVHWRLGSGPETSPDPGAVRVQVPADIEGMRRDDPETAMQWRRRVRAELKTPMADGWRVAAFTGDGCYLLNPPEEAS